MKNFYIVIVLLIISFFNLQAQVKILSGFKDATYFQMTKEIDAISDLNIINIPSLGSRDNYKKLVKDEVDFAFLQYDVLYFETGNEQGKKKNVSTIRIVLPLGFETVHLITRKTSNINSLADLKGKKVGVGSKEQGTFVTATYIKEITGYSWKDVEISFADALPALSMGQIDAFFFVGAAPVAKLNEVPKNLADDIKFIPITDTKLEDYYMKVKIEKGTYPWQKDEVQTYAVRYALATNTLNDGQREKDNVMKLLTDTKNNIENLQSKGHSMWRMVDFNYERINWEVHDAAIELFKLENIKNIF